MNDVYTGFAHTLRIDEVGNKWGFQTFAFKFSSTSALEFVWQKLTYYNDENPYAIVFSCT